ncbi:hybrid sensor histidine kinase/response regulator transcription factor [Fibrella forsythiae]|uniref:histidine kinase n=1 Tax=Fibrella forsythiae TaxID=2817061 RepID=A0ABS3JRD5_9BACT|nr:ATP-binding protein [Fibrella forsythiae]MBO0952567.1 response regulator [Fibrella forsythiae]
MRLFCLFVCLWPSSIFAQFKGWQELTISDGLSQGMIYDLKQDHKGFIWAATKDGLNRYDGYNFTVFTHTAYNEYSLSANTCSTLLVDHNGRLWVGTLTRGLNLYDDRTQRFYHIDMSDPASPASGNNEIVSLNEDPEGNIWAGTSQNKLVKITLSDSLKTGFPTQANATGQVQFSRFLFPLFGSDARNAPSHIVFLADGQAMVSAAKGLFALNWKQPSGISQIAAFSGMASLVHPSPKTTRSDYWFGFSSDTLVGWQGAKRRVIALPPIKNYNVYLAALDDQTIAVATPDYLWLMSPAQLYAQGSLSARNAFAVMPPNVFAVSKLLIDKTGNIWVGTGGYGLRRFSPRIKQFRTYLPSSSLSYLFEDRQGQTYVRDQFDYGQLDRSGNRRFKIPFRGNDKIGRHDKALYFMQDRQGFFWASMNSAQPNVASHQLVKFSESWQRLKTYPLPAGTAFGLYGNQTREDRTGHLWIGAMNGKLLRFDPATETFTQFSYQHLLPRQAAEVETYSLYFDGTGTGWIGTQSGLIRVDHPQTTPAFSLYRNDVAQSGSLSNDFVSSTIDDPDQPQNYLWVSTKGGGLERLNKQTGQFRHFTEAQGLPNKVVYGILTDEFKRLWMSTNRGLAQFNPRTFTFRKYTKADGLQDDEFNTGSFLTTASGELLFGGVNGLTSFRPKDVVTLTSGSAPLVHVIGLKINNEALAVGDAEGMLPQSIEQTTRLDLSHTQNLVTLEFALMDYANSTKNQFRFRLSGIDQDWVEAGTNRFANYAQLPSGTYTFEVEGSANGDVWSRSVPLIIRIHPPFYRTWWAYVLYGCILVLLGWQAYKFQKQRWLLQQQVRFEQKEASRLAELDTLKTQFFTNISHEFRTPLTLILGPLTDLKRRFLTEKVVMLTEPVVTLMEQNSNRLLSLINQLLDLSKLEANQLKAEPQPGDMAVFFRTLASSFSSLAQTRQIEFSFTQPPTHFWASFDRDKIEKIVTNLLSNAFKFTPAGQQVHLRIDYPFPGENQEVVITVADTGIGIAPANLASVFERFYQVDSKASRMYEGTGIGLSLVNELVKVLGGKITVASTEGVGTTFTVCLPVVSLHEQMPGETYIESDEPVLSLQRTQTALSGTSLPAPATENVLLIIDDNADIRAYVRSVFQADYHIIEARDGQDGLEQATASLPTIIICDLMMPRLDGLGFCRLLKNQETTSHIPVIMLTAKATVEDRIEGLEVGADDYLTKPFNQAELEVRVRNLMQKQARLQQYYTGKLDVVNNVPNVPMHSAKEEAFLRKARALVMSQLADSGFGVEPFSQQMNMSQSQLVRKLKALTGQTAVEYIRTIRLDVAAERLRQGESVSEVAYQVGFESLSYFSRVFQDKFGVTASAYDSHVQPDRR